MIGQGPIVCETFEALNMSIWYGLAFKCLRSTTFQESHGIFAYAWTAPVVVFITNHLLIMLPLKPV
jgi:hypothetical protein